MKETQRKARPEDARRWGDRSSRALTGRLEEYVHAHQVKCKDSGDPWIAPRIAAADLEEFGYGDQERS